MLKKYLLNNSGNFGIMFSVSVSFLMLGIGAAIDIASAGQKKSDLQSMVDMAALAASTSGETDQNEVKNIVKKFIEENNVTGMELTPIITFDDDHIQVKLMANYHTQIMGMFGKKNLPLSVLAETPQKLEIPINIALVLDTTWSMNGANMTSLKSASSKLLDSFEDAEDNIKVGVVPFSNYVNVGLSNRNVKWMEVPADTTTVNPAGDCYMYQPTVCSIPLTTVTETRHNDGIPYQHTSNVCNGSWVNDGPEKEYCPSETTTTVKWNGCVGSRDNDRHKEHAYQSKKFPGLMNTWCADPILELTDDIDDVKNKIQSLNASKETYIPAGLTWGWRLLEADDPYGDLSKKEAKLQRALVLMTDGKNTLSLDQPYHNDDDPDAEAVANQLTGELCTLIKDENIQLYTVAYKFGGGDATAKSVIQNCATNPSMFFEAQNTAQLEEAFENIGKSLYQARLSR